ncbi:MAG: hypothetical protein JSU63_18360 [Phycisphaerales bacterium]|nr:MAG: hypothetical protein JSU63_18360 [Phycisphaerales bacterium]
MRQYLPNEVTNLRIHRRLESVGIGVTREAAGRGLLGVSPAVSYSCGFLLFVAASLASGCQSAVPRVELWVVGDLLRVEHPPQVGRRPDEQQWLSNRVELAGALNETLGCLFALRVLGAPVPQPEFSVFPLESSVGRIAASAITLFRAHPVTISDWPGWHIRSILPDRRDPEPLDVLVPVRAPRGGLPATLQPGHTYYFWADISIPKATTAGTYMTNIEIVSGDGAAGSIDIELTVWPFVLPDQDRIPLIAELDHRRLFSHHVHARGGPLRMRLDDWRENPRRQDLDALLSSTLRLLHEHRLNPVLPELAPIVKVTASNSISVDWGQYDAVAEPCLNGQAFFSRIPVPLWPFPIQGISGLASAGRDDPSPVQTQLLGEYIRNCAEHFAEKGWLDRSYAIVPDAGIPGLRAVEATRRFAALVHGASSRSRITSRLFPQDMSAFGWVDYPFVRFADAVDVWMPPAQFFDVRTMAAERAAGRRTWVAVDRPPFSGSVSVYAPPSHVRAVGWHSEELQVEATFIGRVNAWPDPEANPSPEDCVRWDAEVLLYPGGPFGLNEPVSSVRLKHLRRSMQDGAYRGLLADHGLGDVADVLRQSIMPHVGSRVYRTHFADGRPAGWPEDMTTYEIARRIMAAELTSRAYEDPAKSDSEDFAGSAAWRRFMVETRGLYAAVDGTRVRLIGTRARPMLEVECALTIMNTTRTPIGGELRFADLPAEWEAAGALSLAPIPPGGSRRVKLVASAPVMPTGPDGFLILPVELSTDDGLIREVSARVSYVTALPAPEGIEIDGDLSDWSLGTTNVASGFVLISEVEPERLPAGQVKPSEPTIGFVVRDDRNLYIAINCRSTSPIGTSSSRRNRVRYDDMIPVGEELIEVLIDPLNAGTRSPTDLFHIVLKQTGADMTEKGISFDPPCGLREHWPVDISVATRVLSGRWTAELRIPLETFGPGEVNHAVWGFNITRFDQTNEEFSTWSGARRNAYDPLSLGNLLLP